VFVEGFVGNFHQCIEHWTRGIRLDIPFLDDRCKLGVIERDRDVAGNIEALIPHVRYKRAYSSPYVLLNGYDFGAVGVEMVEG
jgi:hypothetical protein